MTKKELVNEIVKNCTISKKDAESVLTSTFTAITLALESGDQVSIPDFGTFKVIKKAARSERKGRNPKTGETMIISAKPEKKVPKFTPAKKLKNRIVL